MEIITETDAAFKNGQNFKLSTPKHHMSESMSIVSNLHGGKKGGDLKPGRSETPFIKCLFSITGTFQQNHLAENTEYRVSQQRNRFLPVLKILERLLLPI